jgi:hypothetical protein
MTCTVKYFYPQRFLYFSEYRPNQSNIILSNQALSGSVL